MLASKCQGFRNKSNSMCVSMENFDFIHGFVELADVLNFKLLTINQTFLMTCFFFCFLIKKLVLYFM